MQNNYHPSNYLRVRDFTWWVWLSIALFLALGLTVNGNWITTALAISVGQFAYFLIREQSLRAFSVQLRGAFAYAVGFMAYSPLRPGLWVSVVGVLAMLIFGYCLLARLLYLLPWNRDEPLSAGMLARTFFTPPDLRRALINGAPAESCPGGVCTLEVQLGRGLPEAQREAPEVEAEVSA